MSNITEEITIKINEKVTLQICKRNGKEIFRIKSRYGTVNLYRETFEKIVNFVSGKKEAIDILFGDVK